jgi:hypothetical protein
LSRGFFGLLTYGPWPGSGEIDTAEEYSTDPDRAIPYLHYYSTSDESTKTNNYCMIADVAEWTAGSIKIIYDRTTCLVHKISPSGDLTGRRRSAPTRRRCRR